MSSGREFVDDGLRLAVLEALMSSGAIAPATLEHALADVPGADALDEAERVAAALAALRKVALPAAAVAAT